MIQSKINNWNQVNELRFEIDRLTLENEELRKRIVNLEKQLGYCPQPGHVLPDGSFTYGEVVYDKNNN